MPVLAVLLKALLGSLYGLLVALVTQRLSMKLAGILFIAGGYVVFVVLYTTTVAPLIALLFSTAYGNFIGLMFPPIAGSVLAGVVGLWIALVVKNYYARAIKIGVS
jgi:hypothetical protein